MRVFVKVCDELGTEGQTYAIPCSREPALASIAALKQEALRRARKAECREGKGAECFCLSLAGHGAVLSEGDAIEDVLSDGDFLCLRPKKTPARAPSTEEWESLPHYGVSVYQMLSTVKTAKWIELDGYSLTVEDLVKIGRGQYRVKLSPMAVEAIKQARAVVDEIVKHHRVAYGITTGFGKFANVVISQDKVIESQENLILSHAVGVGPPLSPEQTRRLLTLRINVLAKGFSGVRLETVQKLIDALNASCLSYVPEQGTVGASGDLCPLAHLALGLMGRGKMWSPESGWANAKEVLEAHGLSPISPQAKEGLSMINGTQLIVALGSEALYRAEMIAKQADLVAALSIEALQGTPRAFDPDVHANRPHPGQQLVAARLRALLDSNIYPSEIREGHKNCSRVQDAYSMRCVPQVHGVVHDTIPFVKKILTTEMNSAVDNPIVVADRYEVISGGNFHGEYPAKALDYLAIGVHELASISERRQERLMNPAYSDLPAFLVNEGGLNSGLMMAHVTSAALVSENKVLTHPSSVDSITTSAGQEDHVSMGGYSARKAITVVRHVEEVLAIELLCACQGLEFLRPKKTTLPLEEIYKLVRTVARSLDHDRYMAPDIAAVAKLLREGKVWEVAKPYIDKYESEIVQPKTPPTARHSRKN